MTAGDTALLLIDTIIRMSDEAEALGGATSIAGVASLHKMQRSIQKNKKRIAEVCKKELINNGAW